MTWQAVANVLFGTKSDTTQEPIKTDDNGRAQIHIDNGADVNNGTTTDVAVDGDAAGTISAKLRGINKKLAGTVTTQDALQSGTWNYTSSTLSGAGSVVGTGRCIGIRVFASGILDGSFNINGGNTINVRTGFGVDINPGGTVTAPTVNWVSGTLDIIISSVT